MARAFRPRLSPNSMASRQGSQALARGLGCGDAACPRPVSGARAPTSSGWDGLRSAITSESVITSLAGFAAPESVITWLAGFWRSPPPTAGRTHGNPSRFQVCTGGFATDPGRLLDPPQRPSQSPQSYDLLFLLFLQDIGHAHGAYKPPPASMSQTLLSLAGFQVILIGRFWVIAEGRRAFRCPDHISQS